MQGTGIAGRMAQLVSHDLSNHLTAIYSNVELISEYKATSVEREELLSKIVYGLVCFPRFSL